MNEHFSDWHRRASFEATPEQLQARWSALQAYLNGAKELGQRLELVRLSHGVQTDEEAAMALARAIQDEDPMFPMEDNFHLLGVLAAAALTDRFENMTGDLQTGAALAVMSAQTLKWKPVLPELVSRAEGYLGRQAHNVRPMSPITLPALGTEMKKAVDALKAITDTGGVPAAELQAAVSSIAKYVTTMYQAIEDGSLSDSQDAIREQVGILWWLFGEASYQLGCRFDKIDHSAAPLILASELSELTLRIPGPPAWEAFLAKALQIALGSLEDAEQAVVIANAINASPREWRAKASIPGSERARIFTPVAQLIVRSAETDSKTAWIATASEITGFDAKKKTQPLLLAAQAYRERLLIRLLN